MKKAFYSFRSPQIYLGDLLKAFLSKTLFPPNFCVPLRGAEIRGLRVELLFYVVFDPTPKGVDYDFLFY